MEKRLDEKHSVSMSGLLVEIDPESQTPPQNRGSDRNTDHRSIDKFTVDCSCEFPPFDFEGEGHFDDV